MVVANLIQNIKMDTKQRMQKCFETLGFSFPFPRSLHVNPSTNFIWQQIINIKTKNEIEVVRKNRMIRRMENKSSKDVIQCPVPEIEIYNQLKTTREQISDRKARILEKHNEHCSLHSNNNANYWIINDVKKRNTDRKMKFHATQMKCRLFEDEIKEIQAPLDNRDITPNPLENSITPDLINEHLQHIVNHTEKCSTNISIEKSSSKSYFSILRKSKLRDTGIQRFVSYTNLPTARVLFADAYEEKNMSMTNCNDLYEFDVSGGLLPKTCFMFNADDEFLLSSQSNVRQKSKRSDLDVNSKEFKTEISDTNTSRQYNSQLEENDKLERDYFNPAFSDNTSIKFIEKILYNSNKELIWGSFCSLLKNILLELEQNMDQIRTRSDICSGKLLPLNFIYIKNNLLCLKSEKQKKIMNDALMENKSEIQKKLNNVEKNTLKTLKFHMEIIKLEGAIRFLHEEASNTNTEEHQTTLKILKTEISKFKNEMQTQVEEIVDYSVKKDDLMKKMIKCQDDTCLVVSKLNKFLFNFSWVHALSGNMKSNEMKTFQKYPLDYAKQFSSIGDDTFFRESMNDLSLDVIAPNDMMYELMSLLHPFDSLEKKIAEILVHIDKMQKKSSEYPDLTIQEEKHFLQQLQEREKYINTFCGNLNTFMHSNKVHHILKSSTYMKLNMELWLDMPFRNFVSSERIVEGKKYKEYEAALEYFGKLK